VSQQKVASGWGRYVYLYRTTCSSRAGSTRRHSCDMKLSTTAVGINCWSHNSVGSCPHKHALRFVLYAHMFLLSLAWLCSRKCTKTPPTLPPSFNILCQEGNLCHVDCSHRGMCDYETGQCSCYDGFYGENCGKTTALAFDPLLQMPSEL